MKKEEHIRKYGEAAYNKTLQQRREWDQAHPEEAKARGTAHRATHPEEAKARTKIWTAAHPEQVKAHSQEQGRKGGKYYEKSRAHQMQGIPHEKKLVRKKDENKWRPYKKMIAPNSQIHHEWLNDGTADFRGVALVEKDPHQYGYVDVIQILDGKITLLTEEEVKKRGR